MGEDLCFLAATVTHGHTPSLCALLGWCLSLGVRLWQKGPQASCGLQWASAAAGAGAVPCVPHSVVTGAVPLPPAGADAEFYEGSNSTLYACRFLGCGV